MKNLLSAEDCLAIRRSVSIDGVSCNKENHSQIIKEELSQEVNIDSG